MPSLCWQHLDGGRAYRAAPYRMRLKRRCAHKLKFHGTDMDTDTDTDTDFLADFRARILARKSACPAPAEVARQSACRGKRGPLSLPWAGQARRSSPNCWRTFVRHARFSSRGCPLERCACTRVRVLYMINIVYMFTKLHDRHILMLVSVSVSVSVPWGSSYTAIWRTGQYHKTGQTDGRLDKRIALAASLYAPYRSAGAYRPVLAFFLYFYCGRFQCASKRSQ